MCLSQHDHPEFPSTHIINSHFHCGPKERYIGDTVDFVGSSTDKSRVHSCITNGSNQVIDTPSMRTLYQERGKIITLASFTKSRLIKIIVEDFLFADQFFVRL